VNYLNEKASLADFRGQKEIDGRLGAVDRGMKKKPKKRISEARRQELAAQVRAVTGSPEYKKELQRLIDNERRGL
jgi:hypothetical protein